MSEIKNVSNFDSKFILLHIKLQSTLPISTPLGWFKWPLSIQPQRNPPQAGRVDGRAEIDPGPSCRVNAPRLTALPSPNPNPNPNPTPYPNLTLTLTLTLNLPAWLGWGGLTRRLGPGYRHLALLGAGCAGAE